jgi:aspartokinase/homoserine dehydrogenase 1
MPSNADILVLGTGVVGRAFIDIVRGRLSSRLRIAGVANSRGLALGREREPFDVDAAQLSELFALPRDRVRGPIDDSVLDRIAARNRGVLVDATADENVGELYERALARGIHVITANKKPLAGLYAQRERLVDPEGRGGRAAFRYEATVGASLPIIETLKNFVRTGDRVRSIDCALSGTLGFVCNAMTEGTPLSRAIAIARERGYTEPDPRDDLGGIDIARKAVILAREIGSRLELADVAVEPFVPRDLLANATSESLGADLAKLDAAFADKVARLRERSEKLVYLARIQVDIGGVIHASAGPVAIPLSHPAAQLQGSSALVAFTTLRHALEPLIVRGSGAGGPVTASALLADIFAAIGTASVPPRDA